MKLFCRVTTAMPWLIYATHSRLIRDESGQWVLDPFRSSVACPSPISFPQTTSALRCGNNNDTWEKREQHCDMHNNTISRVGCRCLVQLDQLVTMTAELHLIAIIILFYDLTFRNSGWFRSIRCLKIRRSRASSAVMAQEQCCFSSVDRITKTTLRRYAVQSFMVYAYALAFHLFLAHTNRWLPPYPFPFNHSGIKAVAVTVLFCRRAIDILVKVAF